MSLTLWHHPLSSFCWKALIALYEADVAFTPRLVNLGDPADRAAFQAVWPLAKFPVLSDDAGQVIPESTIIVEWLAQTQAGTAGLIPGDPDRALRARLLDRLFDNYVHLPFQQIVSERLRPDDQKDPYGVARNREAVRAGYALVEPMIAGPWAMGEAFTLADCAALPALYYADYAEKLPPGLAAYLERLKARPSVARVLAEAEPWFEYFPLRNG